MCTLRESSTFKAHDLSYDLSQSMFYQISFKIAGNKAYKYNFQFKWHLM